ncbi:MAG: T9SS type A sorting domain-containing protein, partial [Candidatus Eisenbacteria bacterium]|nr:T9SS type A sorting domain-containing protein [Candidatus Eisenbacteria bacterium]
PTIVADGAGGAIVTWYDGRSGAYDIYAQRVARFGYLGTPEAEIIGARDVPNDNGGKIKLSWNASYLDLNSDPNLAWYEIYRSVPPNLAAAAVARGARVLRSFAEAPSAGTEAVVVEQARGYSWEYLTTQNALHYISSYSYLAATAEDSTSYQNPKTAFMIVARNTSGSMYWLSRPDSGYSVDNLPPLAPAPFAGQYNAGVAHLHWNPNSESDLANYRLYRGTTSGFTPSSLNRIATPTDTFYDDAAGSTYYYKLSAIDIHGNESGYTTLLPAGALDAGPLPPRPLTLERPSPNPARGPITLRFTLPRESSVTLAIFDPSGRAVRTLADGVTPAGDHQATWDLRDEAGRAVGAGLYFVRLEAEGRSLTRRMTAMR